jgi:integrase
MLMRDTGMRNERELYRVRIENINWNDKIILVPDSKTPDGRRMVPMSDRVISPLRTRCGARREGWVFPSKRSGSGHLTTVAKRFREARAKAGASGSVSPDIVGGTIILLKKSTSSVFSASTRFR